MTAHTQSIRQDMRVEARALRDMAEDFRHIGFNESAALCIEKAESLEMAS